jgi:hypothetical protein
MMFLNVNPTYDDGVQEIFQTFHFISHLENYDVKQQTGFEKRYCKIPQFCLFKAVS